jgi:hypothetical protein
MARPVITSPQRNRRIRFVSQPIWKGSVNKMVTLWSLFLPV